MVFMGVLAVDSFVVVHLLVFMPIAEFFASAIPLLIVSAEYLFVVTLGIAVVLLPVPNISIQGPSHVLLC